MKQTNKAEYLDHAVIAVGFTTRHLLRAAKGLKQELDKHFSSSTRVRVIGSKQSQWIIVEVGRGIEVHLLTEMEKQQFSLEDMWFDKHIYRTPKPSMEQIKKMKRDLSNPFKFWDINK